MCVCVCGLKKSCLWTLSIWKVDFWWNVFIELEWVSIHKGRRLTWVRNLTKRNEFDEKGNLKNTSSSLVITLTLVPKFEAKLLPPNLLHPDDAWYVAYEQEGFSTKVVVGTCCTIQKHFHKFPKRCHRWVLLKFVYFIHTRKQGEGEKSRL